MLLRPNIILIIVYNVTIFAYKGFYINNKTIKAEVFNNFTENIKKATLLF